MLYLRIFILSSQIVTPKYHILWRWYDRFTIWWIEYVLRSNHESRCLLLCFISYWYMYRHLITIKIGIKRTTTKWMKLNCFSFDEPWTESLNTKTMKCRSTIEKYMFTFNYLIKCIPHLSSTIFDNFLGHFRGKCNFIFDKFSDNKRLEECECHRFW